MLVQITLRSPRSSLIKVVKLSDKVIPTLLMTRYQGLALRNQLHLLNHGVDLLFGFTDQTHGTFKVKMTLVDPEYPTIALAA